MGLLVLSEGDSNLDEHREKAGLRMSRAAGMIRNVAELEAALKEAEEQLHSFETDVRITDYRQGGMLYHLLDMLISQKVYLSAHAGLYPARRRKQRLRPLYLPGRGETGSGASGAVPVPAG